MSKDIAAEMNSLQSQASDALYLIYIKYERIEHVIVYSDMPSKFPLATTWEDDNGKKYTKEQIVTI